MKNALLISALLLPQLGWGQLFGPGFQPGSYVLKASPRVRQQGLLKQQGSANLLLRGSDGKKTKLPASEVQSFSINGQKFVSLSGFRVGGDLGGFDVAFGFAEQLDSGRVMMWRFTYPTGSAMTTGAGGVMTGGGGETSVVLLSWSGRPGAVAVPTRELGGGGRQFREAVRPFLAERPDIQKALDDKLIVSANLRRAIRALNANAVFTPPPPFPD